jgi:hypothetical protein
MCLPAFAFAHIVGRMGLLSLGKWLWMFGTCSTAIVTGVAVADRTFFNLKIIYIFRLVNCDLFAWQIDL